jgi:hypothetical protein
MVVHTGEKSFLCSECGGSFGSASTLIDHRKRKHLEMREHRCEECAKGFFTRQELEAGHSKKFVKKTQNNFSQIKFIQNVCSRIKLNRKRELKKSVLVHADDKYQPYFAVRQFPIPR